MSKRSFIDSIEVKKACSEDWDAMTGNERVRFCGHCSQNVNDLSELTRKQAMRLVRDAGGKLCVRYVKSEAGSAPFFARPKLYQLTRRATVAAGILSATLSLSTLAAAQNEPVTFNKQPVTIERKEPDKPQEGGMAESFTGYIFDQDKAPVANASVTLTDLKTNRSHSTTTDSDGFYSLEDVPSARYKVTVTAAGFKEASMELDVFDGDGTGATMALESGVAEFLTLTMGEVAFVSYRTPLATAVSADDLEKVKYLISRGENVNAKEKEYSNITPLFLAVENGNAEIAETLLNFGARINARDDNRQTPLMRLDEDASAELVNLLIKHGARVNLTDKDGNTALIFAARSANAEVLQLLIARAADVDAKNAAGRTALMEAADADNLENVRALLAAGADPNLKDDANETALDLTTSDEIEKLLETHGAHADDDSQ